MFAFAHVAGQATRSPSRRNRSRRGRFAAGGSCVVLRLFHGRRCGGGLQKHFAPARSLVRDEMALNSLHFSGGPSRAFGWVAGQPGSAPAAFQIRRVLAKAVAAICQVASNLGLALARAASDNKSMHTDTQVLSAASRPRLMGAGDFRR